MTVLRLGGRVLLSIATILFAHVASADILDFQVRHQAIETLTGPCDNSSGTYGPYPYYIFNFPSPAHCSMYYRMETRVWVYSTSLSAWVPTELTQLPAGHITVAWAEIFATGTNIVYSPGGSVVSYQYPSGTTMQNLVGTLIGSDLDLAFDNFSNSYYGGFGQGDAYIHGQYQTDPPTYTITPARRDISTGDTTRTVTTASNNSTQTFSPSFTIGTTSSPNSSCAASLTFAQASGTGTVTTVVTAGPANCGGVFDGVHAVVSGISSQNTTQIVVPPQIMIKVVVGEAGGQPGDLDQQSLLVVARNRFGDRDFGRPQTWQAALVPSQFYGANDPTTNGPDQELGNSAKVFTGEVGDIIGGSKCYWSPTNTQWAAIQVALNSGTTTEPANVGMPACWANKPRQAVVKSSLGTNISGGPNYNQAPVFVFLRQRARTDPAVVQIP